MKSSLFLCLCVCDFTGEQEGLREGPMCVSTARMITCCSLSMSLTHFTFNKPSYPYTFNMLEKKLNACFCEIKIYF